MARIYILQNGAMWNCGKAEYVAEMEPGDYIIYLISAEGRSDEPYLAQTLLAQGYPLGALSSYFFEEPEEEDLARLISPGKGLALHEDGKLKVAAADVIAESAGLGVSGGKLKVQADDIISDTGGLATDAGGKLKVQPSDLIMASAGLAAGPDNKLKVQAGDLIASGGGLGAADGKIRVELSGMAQTERESLALSLGVLPRLSADLHVYVNPAGSNAPGEGRGLSAALPFQTIQAAVDWVRGHRDLCFYNAIIHLSAGSHAGGIVLREFSASGGGLIFQGEETGAEPLTTIILGNDMCCLDFYGSYPVTLKNIKFKSAFTASVYRFCSQLRLWSGAVTLDRFESEINLGDDMAANACARFVRVADSSLLIQNTGAAPSKISVLNYAPTRADCVFDIQPNGYLNFGYGASAEAAKLIFTGQTRDCLALNGGNFTRYSMATPITPQGVNYSARRYALYSGAVCRTGGAGPEFFPGNEAGYCDASSSYS